MKCFSWFDPCPEFGSFLYISLSLSLCLSLYLSLSLSLSFSLYLQVCGTTNAFNIPSCPNEKIEPQFDPNCNCVIGYKCCPLQCPTPTVTCQQGNGQSCMIGHFSLIDMHPREIELVVACTRLYKSLYRSVGPSVVFTQFEGRKV